MASKIPFSYSNQVRESVYFTRVVEKTNKIIQQPVGLCRPTPSDGRNGKAIWDTGGSDSFIGDKKTGARALRGH
jgi:hypothetical protein